MYVVPTPFHLVEGSAHKRTLILPADVEAGEGFMEVGKLVRVEAAELIVGYTFDLRTNTIVPEKVPNKDAGKQHTFRAWRLVGDPADAVSMRAIDPATIGLDAEDPDDAEE